ncbi:MAG: amidohydrolase [Candidatus Palauibacterales bacterium]|nr:amidohydrolase [Candidatus Palauibacterales bacterium]
MRHGRPSSGSGRAVERWTAIAALVLPVLGAGCTSEAAGLPAADLVMRSGRVVTVDEALPEAEAIAIRGDRIVFVGSDEDAEAYTGEETQVVDLAGRLTIPGFIEGHAHFMALGVARLQLDLMDTRSYSDLIERVASAVAEAEPGDWIVGRGWHQSKWEPPPEPSVRGFQTHSALSAVSPDNPVLLRHASGHASFANARAMELAGITADTPDPPGGEIIRDADGNPTGIFVETASSLVSAPYVASRAAMSKEEIHSENLRALQLAASEALSKGITTFQDAGADSETLALYREAIDAGDLDLRLWVMISATVPDLESVMQAERVVGYGDDRLTVRAVKAYADGALGSRGAWLMEPYSDDPGNSGFNTVPLAEIERVTRLALRNDYQVCTHAIGDRANHEILDLYEAAFAAAPEASEDIRFRIEHAQILDPADVPRFAELGVVAAMQGIHAISDGPWTPDRLGEERTRERAFQFRALIDSGATVMNGTDAPVEDVDPIPSYFGSVVGRMNNGEVLNPDQLMTRMEGLRAYTINSAYGAHEEGIKGSLTVGKLADIVVLSRDILAVPADEILDARVDLTIVGGKIAYTRPGP